MMFFLEYEMYRVGSQMAFFMCPLFGVMLGAVHLGPLGALLGLGGGIFVGTRLAMLGFMLYRARAKECYIAGRSTAELLEELRGPAPRAPWILLEELAKRGQDLLPELPIVHALLASPDAEKRLAGWEALHTGFPDLYRDITGTAAGKPPEDCTAAVRFLEEFRAQLRLPTGSSSGTPS